MKKDNMKISTGSKTSGSDSDKTVGTWNGTPKDGRDADDTKTSWEMGSTPATRKPLNMTNHERSPLS